MNTKVLLLLIGWLNHIASILIMSQGVGLSSEEKKALELRTHELTQEIEKADFVPANGIVGTNHCNPVNGVHASWCTGHDSEIDPIKKAVNGMLDACVQADALSCGHDAKYIKYGSFRWSCGICGQDAHLPGSYIKARGALKGRLQNFDPHESLEQDAQADEIESRRIGETE